MLEAVGTALCTVASAVRQLCAEIPLETRRSRRRAVPTGYGIKDPILLATKRFTNWASVASSSIF